MLAHLYVGGMPLTLQARFSAQSLFIKQGWPKRFDCGEVKEVVHDATVVLLGVDSVSASWQGGSVVVHFLLCLRA